jgi:hypothetical protein
MHFEIACYVGFMHRASRFEAAAGRLAIVTAIFQQVVFTVTTPGHFLGKLSRRPVRVRPWRLSFVE